MRGHGGMRFGGMGRGRRHAFRPMVGRPLMRPYLRRRAIGGWGLRRGWLPLLGLGALGVGAFLLVSIFF